MTAYLASDQARIEQADADVFANLIEQVRAIDPEAIDDETSTIVSRNADTGELEPDVTRTTGWATPTPAVQGFTVPVPGDSALQIPTDETLLETTTFNPWPTIRPGGTSTPLPAWVQPTGAHDAYILDAWVTHEGYDYINITPANVWPPSPQSTFWRISPDPGPLPWVQPTGASDAYDIGDEVYHEVEGRTERYWRSNIAANTTEPGTDGTFDRWWAPIDKPGGTVTEWVQPMPGTANAPYEIEAQVTHSGKAWINTVQMNVWEPGVFGWDEAVPTQVDTTGKP